MIKFTMGSSDAKKTPRRKAKRTGKSYLLPSNLSGSGSNPNGGGSNSQAPTKTVVNGFQNTMPTSTNTFMHSLGDSLTAYSQWQQTQEGQTMQKQTSGRVKGGEVLSSLPFTKFYLNSECCFVCHRPKIGNDDLNLGQFESDSVSVDVSACPQLWVCIECQQSFDRGGIDPMAGDLQEEILLDPPSSPVLGEVSESLALSANSCNCSSCTGTRQEQNENFELELQQYLYGVLRRLATCVYQSSPPTVAPDAHEGYQLSEIKAEKMHDLMLRFYCRDPQRLFQCLEAWVQEFITERRSGLFVQLPASGQQMTVSMASHLITSLLNEYSCFCIIGQHLMSSFDLRENPIFKGFQLTIELHHKYLFHRMIYTELHKYLTNAVALISLQSTKLRKENAAACNFYSQLLQEYLKLQEEMSRVLMEWQEYCQLTENGKQELVDAQEKLQKMLQNDNEDLARWAEIQKQSGPKLSETKTMLCASHEGIENHLMDRVWQDSMQESNEADVDLPYSNYGETCMCKCDMLAGMVGSDSSDVVAFPSQLLLTSCSQSVSFKNAPPSVSSSTRLSSSGSASSDDSADADGILTKFIRNPRDELCSVSNMVNGRLQMDLKEDEDQDDEDQDDEDDGDDEDDDDEDDDDEEPDEQDALHNSSPNHRIAELNGQYRKSTNFDDDNSSDEDDDEDDDYEDDLEIKVLRVAIGSGILRDSELSSSQALEAVVSSDGSASTSVSASATMGTSVANGTPSGIGGATAVTSGTMFAFGENQDAQTTTGPAQQQQRQQQQQQPPCQCSSCVSHCASSLAADLPQQPLMPSLSSLSIYPHIHGPTTSGLQPLGHDPCTSRASPQLHPFPLRRQQGDGMEQLAPKVRGPEPESMFLNQAMLSDWELQNSSFFTKQNDYGKILMANSGSPSPFTTLSLASNEVQPTLDGGAWFKLDRPVVVTHSCMSSSKGVVMSSSGVFSGMTSENRLGLGLSSSNLRHPGPQVTSNEAPLFPLSMPSPLPVAKYGMEQQPYCFQLPIAPLPVATTAAAVFSSSSSFYQIAAAPALFVQPQNACQAISVSGTNSASPHGLSSPRLRAELMPTACMNGAAGIAMINSVSSTSQKGSAVDGAMISCIHPDHRPSVASSSTSATPMCSDAMGQFSLVSNGYPPVNFGPNDHNVHPCTDTMNSPVPLSYHHTMPCQRSGSNSLPPAGSCEDQHSSAYCKADSQQDEEGFNSQDESGSSSSNQKDGKYCDCWHCEVFGHSTPLTLPTSKNYAEMRDRLRLRLKKKQNEQKTVEPEKVEEKQDPVHIDPKPSQQEVQHLTDIEELLKFINGEDEAMEKSKAKAAKRSRQKLRKLQQKAKEARSDENSRRSCASNKRKNAPSPGTSRHVSNQCTADHSCSLNTDPHRHPGIKSKGNSGDMEGLKFLNVLNSMNFHGDHISRSDKSERSKTCEGKTQGSGEKGKEGVRNAGNSEEERRRRSTMLEQNERRVTASGISQQNGNCGSDACLTNSLLRQSSSRYLLLEKTELDLAKKAKAKEVSQQKSILCDSPEVKEPSRVEEGMKPVTISSEEGMRTILASPLLQAELAKNKPLQKLFMQAVQQQKESREKQEASAAAALAEAKAKSQHLSTEHMSTAQRNHQQQPSAKRDPTPGKRPQENADLLGVKQKSQVTQGRAKGPCKPSQNQPQCAAEPLLKPQVIPSQLNAIPGGKVSHPTIQPSRAKEGQLPQEPCRVSEIKPQQPQPLSHSSTTQTSQTSAKGKSRHKQQQLQLQQISGNSCGNKDQQLSNPAPKNKLQPQNTPNGKQANGGLVGSYAETAKRPVLSASQDTTVHNDDHLLSSKGSPANAEAKSKPENKKTAVDTKKNKKSSGPPIQIVGEVQLVSKTAKLMINGESNSNFVDVNDRTCNGVSCSPELETHITNSHLERTNSSTVIIESSDAASLENNKASNGAVVGAGATAKSKKSKRKSKSKNNLTAVDEIFMPKDVPVDSHLDENEREIEEFKRFCSNSAPSENRKKVNLNNVRELFNKNVKDLFNKKRTAAAGCQ